MQPSAAHDESKWEVLDNRRLLSDDDTNVVMKAISEYYDQPEKLHRALSRRFKDCTVLRSQRGLFFYNSNTTTLFRETDGMHSLHVCIHQPERAEIVPNRKPPPKTYCRSKDKEKLAAIHQAILNADATDAQVDFYVHNSPPVYPIIVRLRRSFGHLEAVNKWVALPHKRIIQVLRLENIPDRIACVQFIKSMLHLYGYIPFELDRACELYEQLKAFCDTKPATRENLVELKKIALPLCRVLHTVIIPELIVWVHPFVVNKT